MEIFTVTRLSFSYPEARTPALTEIGFSVREGEFLTVCGASGSGKSTLLRLLKPSLSPHGTVSGDIRFAAGDIRALSHRQESERIGFVQQSPENQLVTDKVWHELAFGMESLGLENAVIRRRVAETASFFGVEALMERDVATLSGGQKQLLNLAAVMTMQPEVLILDEPTAQLDPIAAADFFACLRRVNRELGVTVIISEHKLEELFPLSDRVMVLDGGKLLSLDTPVATGKNPALADSGIFRSMPAPIRIRHAVSETAACPVTVAEGREWLRAYAARHEMHPLPPESIPLCGEEVLRLQDVWFRYQKDSPDVLKNLSVRVNRGEFLAILGGNGAGKSTLLSVMNGLEQPYHGKRSTAVERIATLPQNPRLLLSGNTVDACLREMLDGATLSAVEREEMLREVVRLCSLEHLLERHPFDLSGGETQRAALAKILLAQPELLLLDEPTKGMDAVFRERFAAILLRLNALGTTIVMVSHDVAFCARYPHRCLMLFNGELVAEGTPRRFFASNTFYVTAARRMSKGVLEDAVTVEDVIYGCTGKAPPETPETPPNFHLPSPRIERDPPSRKLPLWKKLLAGFGGAALLLAVLVNLEVIPWRIPFWGNLLLVAVPTTALMAALGSLSSRTQAAFTPSKLSKRTIAATVAVLLTIPVTILIGTVYLDDRRFLFISLLVLLECMLPFFLVFEGRKPQAREMVIIAVMCALAVAGRSAFAALPQIKPVLALVIIAGIAFGAESGFMVGAVAMLVSNIYFGQGAWTPWQMFAAGLIGFLAGLLFQKGFLRRNRGALCVFGFITTIMVYGLLMNFSTIVLARVPITWESLVTFYAQGLPFDVIHALSTLVILFFAAEPMLRKLDRVKTKYGLLEKNA